MSEADTDQTKPAPRWPSPPTVETPVVPLERQFKAPKRAAFYRLLQGQLQSTETARAHYIAKPDPTVTRADILRKAFWSHVARTLRPGDRIDVLADDSSWFMELVVRASNGTEAEVGELRYVTFDAIAARNPDDYEIAKKGPAKWRITRKIDNVVVKEGLESEGAALAWLATPLTEQAA